MDRGSDGCRALKNPDRNPRDFLIVFVGVGGVSAIDFVGVVDPLGGGDSPSRGWSRIVNVSNESSKVGSVSAVPGVSTGDCNAEIVLDATLKGRRGLRMNEIHSAIALDIDRLTENLEYPDR